MNIENKDEKGIGTEIFDKMIEVHQINFLRDIQKIQTERMLRLEVRINTLEKLSQYNMSKEVQELMNSRFNECMKRIEELEQHYRESKKPHKCPVCEGNTIINCEPFDDLMRAGLPTNRKCPSCEGKGIVWG